MPTTSVYYDSRFAGTLSGRRRAALVRWALGCLLAVAGLGATLSAQYTVADLPGVESYGGRISVRRDLPFGTQDYQTLDLYLPLGVGPFPAVVCWFGGNFVGGNKSHMARIAAFLASIGIAAVTPEYYLATLDGSRPGWPANVHDAKAAVRHVRSKAAEWRLDPARIAGLGYSSGAYLAMMVAFTPHVRTLEGDGAAPGESSALVAVVDIAGVCDRRGSLGTGTLPLLGHGYEARPELRTLASPVAHVGPTTVPVYILHGEHDSVAQVESALKLAEALKAHRVPHHLQLVEAGHFPIATETIAPVAQWLKQRLGP